MADIVAGGSDSPLLSRCSSWRRCGICRSTKRGTSTRSCRHACMRCRTLPRQRRCRACTGTWLYCACTPSWCQPNRAPSVCACVCACAHARWIVVVIRMAIQDGDDNGNASSSCIVPRITLSVCRRRKHSPSKSSCTPLVGPCGAAAASALYSSPALTDPCGCVCVCMARGASVKPTPAEGLVYQRRIAEASVPAVY